MCSKDITEGLKQIYFLLYFIENKNKMKKQNSVSFTVLSFQVKQ